MGDANLIAQVITQYLLNVFLVRGANTVLAAQCLAVLMTAFGASSAAHAQFSPSISPPPGIDLSGNWTSNQFQCPLGTFHTETITIAQSGNFFSAVKATGDACVPAGKTTFKGSLSRNSGSITCTGGSPNNPASSTSPGTLRVINANSIEACGMVFTKVASATTTPAARPPVSRTTPDYTANLVGSTWTYSYGSNVYQFTFGRSTIDNFSNGWWPGVSWSVVGPNQLRLWDSPNQRAMFITFNSPTSYRGTDWDKRTAVSGTLLSSRPAPVPTPPPTAVAPPKAVAAPKRPSGPTKAQREAEVKDVITQVKGEFRAQGMGAGATAVFEDYGSLDARSYADKSIGQLSPGYEYSVAVVCDNICGEIELTVTDGSGRNVGSNVGKKPLGSGTGGSQKAMPWTQVLVTPNQAQLYKARVAIGSCPTNPCEWGLLVSSAALSATATNPTQSVAAPVQTTPAAATPVVTDRVKHVRQFVDVLQLEFQQQGGIVFYRSDGTDTLTHGDFVNIPFPNLQPGRAYRFEGTCDLDCLDLNLSLYDGSGAFVPGVADLEPDKEPYIEFVPTPGVQYGVQVHMAGCRGGHPCHWALVGATER